MVLFDCYIIKYIKKAFNRNWTEQQRPGAGTKGIIGNDKTDGAASCFTICIETLNNSGAN